MVISFYQCTNTLLVHIKKADKLYEVVWVLQYIFTPWAKFNSAAEWANVLYSSVTVSEDTHMSRLHHF